MLCEIGGRNVSGPVLRRDLTPAGKHTLRVPAGERQTIEMVLRGQGRFGKAGPMPKYSPSRLSLSKGAFQLWNGPVGKEAERRRNSHLQGALEDHFLLLKRPSGRPGCSLVGLPYPALGRPVPTPPFVSRKEPEHSSRY